MPRRPHTTDPSVSPWHLLGAELRYLRDEVHGITLREAAAKALCDDGEMSKWERGLAHPHIDTVSRLDDLYGAKGRLTGLHGFAVEFDRLRPGTFESTASDPAEDGDMHRRAAVRLLAALSAGAVIPPGTLETLFSGVEDAIADRGVAADAWEEVAWEHGFTYYTQAPGALVHAVTADLAEVSRLIHRTSSPVTRAALLRVSAQLAVLLGMEMNDLGEQRSSLQSWRLARRAADATGDRELRVWVRGWEAEYGFWSGRPAPVVDRLTGEAIRIAEGTSGAGLAGALRARAFVSASRGDAHTTRTALRDLDVVFEELPDDKTNDRTSPLSTFGERAVAWARAYSSALVGDTAEAAVAVDEALALCPATFTADITHYELVRALTLVRDGDVTEGLAHALTTARAWPVSTMRRRTLDRVLGTLPEKARDSDAARELRDLTAGRSPR